MSDEKSRGTPDAPTYTCAACGLIVGQPETRPRITTVSSGGRERSWIFCGVPCLEAHDAWRGSLQKGGPPQWLSTPTVEQRSAEAKPVCHHVGIDKATNTCPVCGVAVDPANYLPSEHEEDARHTPSSTFDEREASKIIASRNAELLAEVERLRPASALPESRLNKSMQISAQELLSSGDGFSQTSYRAGYEDGARDSASDQPRAFTPEQFERWMTKGRDVDRMQALETEYHRVCGQLGKKIVENVKLGEELEKRSSNALPDEVDQLDLAEAHIRAAMVFTEGKLVARDRAQTATNDLNAALEYIEVHRRRTGSDPHSETCPCCEAAGELNAACVAYEKEIESLKAALNKSPDDDEANIREDERRKWCRILRAWSSQNKLWAQTRSPLDGPPNYHERRHEALSDAADAIEENNERPFVATPCASEGESPNFIPDSLAEFAARGYERINSPRTSEAQPHHFCRCGHVRALHEQPGEVCNSGVCGCSGFAPRPGEACPETFGKHRCIYPAGHLLQHQDVAGGTWIVRESDQSCGPTSSPSGPCSDGQASSSSSGSSTPDATPNACPECEFPRGTGHGILCSATREETPSSCIPCEGDRVVAALFPGGVQGDTLSQHLRAVALLRDVRRETIEECAKVCEEPAAHGSYDTERPEWVAGWERGASTCARRIRSLLFTSEGRKP